MLNLQDKPVSTYFVHRGVVKALLKRFNTKFK